MTHTTIYHAQKWVEDAWRFSPKKGVQEKDELLFLLEEIGEVARGLRIARGNKEGGISRQELQKEFGDVLLCLLTLANRYGIDLEKGFQESKALTKKRYVKRGT